MCYFDGMKKILSNGKITNGHDLSLEFWSSLENAPHRLLALDYDGTLAPFHLDPSKAFPVAGVKMVLQNLTTLPHDSVAIISGRPVQELSRLLGRLEATYVGSHGFERLSPLGELAVKQPTVIQRRGLERAYDWASVLGFRTALETKVASLALHTRPMNPDAATRSEALCLEQWTAIAAEHELECRRFNGGVEIRSLGRHKGNALLDLISEAPVGTFAVYVGDDDTDEDAFKAVKAHGVGIKVGPAPNGTLADWSLADCSAVKTFLSTWYDLVTADHQRGNRRT